MAKETVMKICLIEKAWLILLGGTKKTVLAVNTCNLWVIVFLSAIQFIPSTPTCREITLYLEVSQL